MTKHTPGPWRITDVGYVTSNHGYVPIVTPFLRSAHRDFNGNANPEAMTNARLIAAAPEMLEALEAFVRRWSFPKKPTGDDLEIYLEATRAAIAKAKGD